ncbi:hypothetical protein CN135_21585 [Sinorhizobium meliloti]|nr:hypothetical protein CN230_11070 [Sinorhizobium meliloti]RVG24127.1 hypothetical protein CN229_26010 [Sinorhizobium meliloti]RVG30844.1 hypothetical protein CN225_22350 [Sinorhizobium meliloti]RVG54145.1 hypothetical protein CN224_23320 [Sinorhizobium meliloti]RVI83259.1 hypothetical protein CN191_06055 [Sinorhizobium meliloti]
MRNSYSPSSILVRAADRSSTIHCGALGQCLPLSSGLPLTLTLSPLAGRGDVPHGRWGASGCGISLLPVRTGRRCRQADEGLLSRQHLRHRFCPTCRPAPSGASSFA